MTGVQTCALPIYIKRLDTAQPDEERLASRFWQGFFGYRFGSWGEDLAREAWSGLADASPQSAESLLAHIPAMSRQFSHGLKKGVLLDESFWADSPPLFRPLTGFAQMSLENGDYSRPAWGSIMEHLEALIGCCRK